MKRPSQALRYRMLQEIERGRCVAFNLRVASPIERNPGEACAL